MAHDYAYTIDGVNPVTEGWVAELLMLESTATARIELHSYAYQDGADVQLDAWTTQPKATLLRAVMAAGDTASARYEGLHRLSGLLAGGKKTLQRVDPYVGTVEAEIAQISSTGQKEGANRLEWDWPIWILPGHFRAAADTEDTASGMGTSATIGGYVLTGTHPTAPVVTLTCVSDGANPAIAMTTGDQESIGVSGAYVASDEIVIDVPARTVTVNGTRAKTLTSLSHGHWLRWLTGITNTLTFTADSGDWDADITYRERWRI